MCDLALVEGIQQVSEQLLCVLLGHAAEFGLGVANSSKDIIWTEHINIRSVDQELPKSLIDRHLAFSFFEILCIIFFLQILILIFDFLH